MHSSGLAVTCHDLPTAEHARSKPRNYWKLSEYRTSITHRLVDYKQKSSICSDVVSLMEHAICAVKWIFTNMILGFLCNMSIYTHTCMLSICCSIKYISIQLKSILNLVSPVEISLWILFIAGTLTECHECIFHTLCIPTFCILISIRSEDGTILM